MATSSKDKADDDELLREIRDRWQTYSQFWKDNYKLGDEDMDCLSAEYGPWPKEAIAERQSLKRPICHLDIVSQFIRRIVNQARINPRGIVITPKGSDATDDTAEMREDRIRQIDYESMAPQARINAMQNAVERGIGFYMVTTDWERPDSLNQKIGTRQIPNPKSVLVDPFCEQPDYSDMAGAFVITKYEDKKYKKKFPKAKDRSFAAEYTEHAPGWMDENTIQVCEYWCVRTKERTKLLLETPEGPQEMWRDEIPDATIEDEMLIAGGAQFRILKQRETEIPSVHQYITNGLEILKRRSWQGSTIPIIMITGYRKYENGKLVIESATRKMKAGQLMYDSIWTNMQEMFGMMPKSHWIAAAGQTEEFPEWADANRDPVAVLRYNAAVKDLSDGKALPPPQRVDYTPRIEAFLNALSVAIQAVQQAAGMFSVERQDRVRASGKAQEVQNETQDIGNYHFSDYLDLAVQYEGRIKNELLRHIEDTKSMRGFRKEDDKYERKEVVPMANPETGEVEQHPYGKGRDHDVIVKAGPSMQSQFDKAADFLDVIAQNPQYGPLVMDLVVHMKQLGPLGKKLAERFEKMLPPHLQETDGQPDPAQLLQQKSQEVEQLKQAFDMVKGELDEAQKKIDAKVIDNQAKIQISQADNATKLAIAEMGAQVKQNSEAVAAFMAKMDSALQLMMQDKDQRFAAQSQMADQSHQAGMQDQQLRSQENMTAVTLDAQAEQAKAKQAQP